MLKKNRSWALPVGVSHGQIIKFNKPKGYHMEVAIGRLSVDDADYPSNCSCLFHPAFLQYIPPHSQIMHHHHLPCRIVDVTVSWVDGVSAPPVWGGQPAPRSTQQPFLGRTTMTPHYRAPRLPRRSRQLIRQHRRQATWAPPAPLANLTYGAGAVRLRPRGR